jgi:uncharacterized protein YndB with AHSA1/START domain
MAVNDIRVDARPEDVWSVLADATTYPDWVVGCKQIRAVDGAWPEVGASFHHIVGAGPVEVRDRTTSLVADQPHRLVLRARARPFGTARVELEITADGESGAHVVMREWPEHRLLSLVDNPILQLAIDRRNARSLTLLKRLAEVRRARLAPR